MDDLVKLAEAFGVAIYSNYQSSTAEESKKSNHGREAHHKIQKIAGR